MQSIWHKHTINNLLDELNRKIERVSTERFTLSPENWTQYVLCSTYEIGVAEAGATYAVTYEGNQLDTLISAKLTLEVVVKEGIITLYAFGNESDLPNTQNIIDVTLVKVVN